MLWRTDILLFYLWGTGVALYLGRIYSIVATLLPGPLYALAGAPLRSNAFGFIVKMIPVAPS